MGGVGRAVASTPAAPAALALGLLLACASAPAPHRLGVFHTVRAGETVYRISRNFGVPVQEIVRANHIRDVHDIPTGARLWIPTGHGVPHPLSEDGTRVAAVGPAAPPGVHLSNCAEAVRKAHLHFLWPIRHGIITSGFGPRPRDFHEGVDIAAPMGTPIHAAEGGRVVYAGRLGDYGRVVILKHVGHWATVYAHAEKDLVHKGEFVERGQVIARVGESGNATGPHVHFEIRRRGIPTNPLLCMP